MNPQDVRELRLALENLLENHLGTYQPSGRIAITTGEPSGESTSDGLECIIFVVPEFGVTPTFTHSGTQLERGYSVRLLDHGDGSRLEAAVSDIVRRYPRAQPVTLGFDPIRSIPAQVAFTIPLNTRVR